MEFSDIDHNLKENDSIPEEIVAFFSKEKNCQVNQLQNYFPLLDFVSKKKNPNYHKNENIETLKLKYNIVNIESKNGIESTKKIPEYSPKNKLFNGVIIQENEKLIFSFYFFII